MASGFGSLSAKKYLFTFVIANSIFCLVLKSENNARVQYEKLRLLISFLLLIYFTILKQLAIGSTHFIHYSSMLIQNGKYAKDVGTVIS
jgi:hypothetical protein